MKDSRPGKGQIPMQVPKSSTKADAPIGRDIQQKIGRQLRAMYDDVVKEGIPDRFNELLQRLDSPGGIKPAGAKTEEPG